MDTNYLSEKKNQMQSVDGHELTQWKKTQMHGMDGHKLTFLPTFNAQGTYNVA